MFLAVVMPTEVWLGVRPAQQCVRCPHRLKRTHDQLIADGAYKHLVDMQAF